MIYTPIKSDPTRVAALLSGDVDMLTDLPTQDVARLRQDSKLKIVDGHEVRTIYIALDQFSPELKYCDVKGKNPFKDKRVREALSIAIDREAIKRNTMRGLSIPAGIMVAPGVNGNTPDIDVPAKVDPERAKKLLADAGYPNGFEFQLNCPNNRYVNDEEICQNLVGMWARIGVKTKLVAESMATFIQKVQNFDTSAYLLGWGVATFDAQYTLQSLIRTRTTGADGNFNFDRISDPKLDALVDAMKTETDVAKRNALIRDALVLTRDEVLNIPLHHQLRPWAMKKGVTTMHRADDRPEARFTSVNPGGPEPFRFDDILTEGPATAGPFLHRLPAGRLRTIAAGLASPAAGRAAGFGQHRQLARRVAVDHQQVGPGARHQFADLAFLAHQPRGFDGGALQHLHRRHRAQAQLELDALARMHVAQQVGAEDHRHAFGAGDLQRLDAARAHHGQLVQHRGRPAQPLAFVGQRHVGGQRRHQVGAMRLHHPRGGLVDQVAVFDGAHAGLHRARHRARRIGMRHRVQVGGLGLLAGGAQFLHARTACLRAGRWGWRCRRRP